MVAPLHGALASAQPLRPLGRCSAPNVAAARCRLLSLRHVPCQHCNTEPIRADALARVLTRWPHPVRSAVRWPIHGEGCTAWVCEQGRHGCWRIGSRSSRSARHRRSSREPTHPSPTQRAASESASPLLALRSHCVSVRERLLPWQCLLLSVGSYSAGCRVPYNMPLL
jgi:hypothetical protein